MSADAAALAEHLVVVTPDRGGSSPPSALRRAEPVTTTAGGDRVEPTAGTWEPPHRRPADSGGRSRCPLPHLAIAPDGGVPHRPRRGHLYRSPFAMLNPSAVRIKVGSLNSIDDYDVRDRYGSADLISVRAQFRCPR